MILSQGLPDKRTSGGGQSVCIWIPEAVQHVQLHPARSRNVHLSAMWARGGPNL